MSEEWKEYFEKSIGLKPVYITITLDNEELIQHLADRRAIVHNLSLLLPPDVNLDDIEEVETAAATIVQQMGDIPCWKKVLQRIGILHDAQVLVDKFQDSNDRILELMQKNYVASHVFVSFDTEAEQRKALSALVVGTIAAWKDDKDAIDDEFLFRGVDVLHVTEAGEPDDVRWLDLSYSSTQIFLRMLLTSLPVIAFIALGAVIVNYVRTEHGPFEAGLTISALNFIVPTLAKIVNSYERHVYVSNYQASLCE